jgi:hypothetical protein
MEGLLLLLKLVLPQRLEQQQEQLVHALCQRCQRLLHELTYR